VGLPGVGLTSDAHPVLLKNSTKSRPQERNADYLSKWRRLRRVAPVEEAAALLDAYSI
jgi:hypothetical protein